MRKFVLFVCILVATALVSSCDEVSFRDMTDVDGSGRITSEIRAVEDFDQVTLAGEGVVIVTEGPEASLWISTDDNLFAHIETKVANQTLEISTERGIDIDPTDSVVYQITTPNLTALTLSGAGEFQLDEGHADAFSIVLSGAGDIDVGNLIADELDVTISGVGSVVLAGVVDFQEVTISGAGSYDGAELETAESTVSSTGAGSATVWANDVLVATLTGVGSIDYFGTPQVTQTVTGIGSINGLGAR